jgi:hypothetical protein
MRRSILGGLLIFTFAMTAVKADIMPPRPVPPPPGGIEKISIRGVAMQRVYTYWKGQRWMTVINSCDASQHACSGKDLAGCFVVGVDGHPVEGGDTGFLQTLDTAARATPIKLTLDHCGANELELNR